MNLEKVRELLLNDRDINNILQIIRAQNLQDAWLCAGTIRNFIWNYLSNNPNFDQATDVDVVFNDPAITYEETVEIEQELKHAYPEYEWELKNKVYMHPHNPNTEPYESSRDAISKFPECCTAIGARLMDDHLEIFCPYGIEDIIQFKVRPTLHFQNNPERMKKYKERVLSKNWQIRWTKIQLEEVY